MEALAIEQKQRKLPNPPRRFTLEEYFKAEEKSLEKNEYHDGLIIPIMAGAMYSHNQLANKATTLIENFLDETELDFTTNNSDIKIRIETYNRIVYPDGVVVSGDPEYYKGRRDTILNPIAVIEVLSNSTKSFDETTKFEMYRTLPSFKEYVLIHQERLHVSVFTKQDDGNWLLRDYEGDTKTAILYHINNCPLPLKRLYRKLKK